MHNVNSEWRIVTGDTLVGEDCDYLLMKHINTNEVKAIHFYMIKALKTENIMIFGASKFELGKCRPNH